MNSYLHDNVSDFYYTQIRDLTRFLHDNGDRIVWTVLPDDTYKGKSKYARKQCYKDQIAEMMYDENMPLELAKLEATLWWLDINMPNWGYSSETVVKSLCIVVNAVIAKYSSK